MNKRKSRLNEDEEVKALIEKKTQEHKRDFSKLSEIKKCPRCGGGLREGHMIIKMSWWNESKPDRWWKFGTRNVPLTNLGTWHHPAFPALRCISCHFVTFDYTSEVERGTVKE